MKLIKLVYSRITNGLVLEKKTKGKGGVRPGAGRSKGSTKEPTKQIRLPVDIANFMQQFPQAAYEEIRKVMRRLHVA